MGGGSDEHLGCTIKSVARGLCSERGGCARSKCVNPAIVYGLLPCVHPLLRLVRVEEVNKYFIEYFDQRKVHRYKSGLMIDHVITGCLPACLPALRSTLHGAHSRATTYGH
jgi:hypothetical protein